MDSSPSPISSIDFSASPSQESVIPSPFLQEITIVASVVFAAGSPIVPATYPVPAPVLFWLNLYVLPSVPITSFPGTYPSWAISHNVACLIITVSSFTSPRLPSSIPWNIFCKSCGLMYKLAGILSSTRFSPL